MRSGTRYEFNDAESLQIALNAYEAGVPTQDWVRRQLGLLPGQKPLPMSAPASEKPATVETPPPEPAKTSALPAVIPAAAPAARRPEPAAAPAPEPAPEPARQEPEEKVETRAADEAPPEKTRKPRQEVPDHLMPKGAETILKLGKEILRARARVMAREGAAQGYKYNMAMKEFYTENGLSEIPSWVIAQIVTLGRDADAIQALMQERPNLFPGDVTPYSMLTIWQQQKPKTTFVVEDGGRRIREVPVEEALGGTGEPAQPGLFRPEPPKEKPTFNNFDEVKFEELPEDDARTLRRFTLQVSRMGKPTPDSLQSGIAASVRKIMSPAEKGKRSPETEQTLNRLCVIRGSSGDYHYRPEFIRRFDDALKWASP